MEPKKDEAAPNPFEGQGGSFYINPKGSNTLKRDRNFDVPFDALSKVEKHARLVAIPADLISDRDRAARIGGLGLTAEDHAAIAATNSSAKAPSSAEPTVAASAAPVAEAAPAVTNKSKGAK